MRRHAENTRVVVAASLGIALGVGFGIAALRWFSSSTHLPVAALPAQVASFEERPLPPGREPPAAPTASTPRVPATPRSASASARRPTAPRTPNDQRGPSPELTDTHEWPVEPAAPSALDEARFIEAFVLLCGPHAGDAVRNWYARWVLHAAQEAGSDPFLLGGLVFYASGCGTNRARFGIGLTGLIPSLFDRDLKRGRYAYAAFVDGSWVNRSIKLTRFPFQERFVESPESGLYFAAGFLRALSEQAPGLRAAFVQPAEYRHFVSHYVWGDQVKSHREEDAILVERRRLLEYYGAIRPRAPVSWRGFELGCPLDGCPRVITSTLGDARDNGARQHAGNDFESTRGEPVRAVADGEVVFAGVDLPGRGAAAKIPIWAQRNVDPAAMGAGGLYVCIDHGTSLVGEQLVSCSMHLESATVVQGRRLKRGDQVGRVGTSGIRESRPHLHFELHSSKGVHRATDILKGIALGRPPSRAADEGARPRHEFAQ